MDERNLGEKLHSNWKIARGEAKCYFSSHPCDYLLIITTTFTNPMRSLPNNSKVDPVPFQVNTCNCTIPVHGSCTVLATAMRYTGITSIVTEENAEMKTNF